MTSSDCKFERAANIGVSLFMLLAALALVVIGVTVLPVLGLLLALPVFILCGAFLFSPRSPECVLVHK